MKKINLEGIKEHLEEMGRCNVADMEIEEIDEAIEKLRAEGINCYYNNTDFDNDHIILKK